MRRRVDVELLARLRVDLGLGLAALVAELLAELVQERDVDADARVFHLREHGDERQLERAVQVLELTGAQRFAERVGELQQDRGAPAGLGDAGVAVEIERALDLVG